MPFLMRKELQAREIFDFRQPSWNEFHRNQNMDYRTLGPTNLKVSVVGFGGYGIGGGYLMHDKAVAVAAIEHAFDRGINYFDTAPFVYNDSEILLGRALRGKRDRVILATKAERLDVYSVRQCVETSLKNLGTDYLDVLQLRDPTVEGLKSSQFREVCAQLKSEGKIRFSAVTVGDAQQVAQANLSMDLEFPVIQLAYNMIFDRAGDELLPRALKEGVGIVARGPLCKGFLADRLTMKPANMATHPNFNWFTSEEADTLLRLQTELSFLAIPGKRSLAQAAIQFVLLPPAVSTTIPSLESPADVDELVGALEAPALTKTEIEQARSVIARFPAIDY